MLDDLRSALRAMRRAPAFFAGAVLILAFGIGLSTAAFEIFYTVLLRPLPVREQERLVTLAGDLPGSRLALFPMKRRLVQRFERETRTLTEVAGIAYDGPWEWKVRDPADEHQTIALHSSVVTGNFFQVLGARAEVGRLLVPQDDARGAKKVVVISHELWQREYGGDAGAIGRRVLDQSSGDAYEIVGVVPAGLGFERGADTWRTLDAQFPILADSDLDSRFAEERLVGRLAPGATPTAAAAELAAFLRREWSGQNPAMASRLTATVQPLADEVVGDVRPALRIASAAVALLLLIACVNVANLLLIRGARRRSELAVRAAIGASRGRLIRQLVIEGAVLVVLGAIVGVSIAGTALAAIAAAMSAYMPRVADARVEGVTVAAAAIIALVAVTVSTVGPALTVSSGELFSLVRSGAASVTGSRRARHARQGLVVVQVALALVVVAAAGLLVESLQQLQRLQLGFAIDQLGVVEVSPKNDAHQSAAMINATMDRLRARLANLPGVASVATAIQTPFSTAGIDGFLTAEGEPESERGTDPVVTLEFISPDFFRTMGIRILRGRQFDASDREGSAPVVIVSHSVAEHYWPNQNPIGKRLRCVGSADFCSVVGVSEDIRYRDLVKTHPTSFQPSRQAPDAVFAPRVLLIRTQGDPAALMGSIRAAVIGTDPTMAIGRATPVRELLAAPLAHPRLNMALMSVFAMAALALASVGIFGVLTFHIAQRTRELGIRQALGAAPSHLRRMVVREGMALQGIGLAVGMAASMVAMRAVRAVLFAVSPTDPWAMFAAVVVLLAFGAAAMVVPALRAGRVDPSVVLRAE